VQYNETFTGCIDRLVLFHKRHVAKELLTRTLEMDLEKRNSAFQENKKRSRG